MRKLLIALGSVLVIFFLIVVGGLFYINKQVDAFFSSFKSEKVEQSFFAGYDFDRSGYYVISNNAPESFGTYEERLFDTPELLKDLQKRARVKSDWTHKMPGEGLRPAISLYHNGLLVKTERIGACRSCIFVPDDLWEKGKIIARTDIYHDAKAYRKRVMELFADKNVAINWYDHETNKYTGRKDGVDKDGLDYRMVFQFPFLVIRAEDTDFDAEEIKTNLKQKLEAVFTERGIGGLEEADVSHAVITGIELAESGKYSYFGKKGRVKLGFSYRDKSGQQLFLKDYRGFIIVIAVSVDKGSYEKLGSFDPRSWVESPVPHETVIEAARKLIEENGGKFALQKGELFDKPSVFGTDKYDSLLEGTVLRKPLGYKVRWDLRSFTTANGYKVTYGIDGLSTAPNWD